MPFRDKLHWSLVVRRRKAYRTDGVFGIFTARCYASAVLAMACVCLSVRLSVTSRCSIKKRMNESSRVLACELPSTRLPEIRLSPKNKSTFLWNFVLNSGLRRFRHGISIVETYYQLSSSKVDAQSVINWAVVGQLSR